MAACGCGPDNASILFSLVRREGTRNTRIVILNGPLPAPPGSAPQAENDTPKVKADAMEHYAKALNDKASNDKALDDVGAPKHENAQRHNDAVLYRASAGGDEARILRERQAWLHSLDVKYGIAR